MKPPRFVRGVLLSCFIALLSIATAGCVGGAEQPGEIELSATEFDLAGVPNDQPVSEVFQVRNAGPGTLEITGVSTSCGCTTAGVAKERLASGEATDLTVTYDPRVHDGETGTFLRVVYVRSDDPQTPEASLTLRVTVVDAEEVG